MSDYLAVGGVTAVLRWLLANALSSGGPSTVLTSASSITAVSPDLIAAGADEEPQLNLFMYYVSLNPALRNLELPYRDAAGNPVSNPPLALNLHYLVSAYGSSQGGQLTAEILLGWAMKVFHDNPVVPADTIQEALTALAGQSSAEAKLVSASTLAGQLEHVRITPESLTTEEIYRLWPAFQAPYRPSSAFRVSVVVIQDTDMVSAALPVRHRRLVALPMQSPVISAVSPVMASVGQLFTLTGANFLGQSLADTAVSIDGTTVPTALVQGGLIRLWLPTSLQAGTRLVRVQRMVTFPGETTPRRGFTSSPVPFQLLPTIKDSSPVQATHGASLTLAVSPPVGRAQQVTVYFGDNAVPVPARLPTAPATSATLTLAVPAGLPVTGTGAGAGVPIRVEVDGASSALNPQAGGGWAPVVQVT
jgi:hypothetical protein